MRCVPETVGTVSRFNHCGLPGWRTSETTSIFAVQVSPEGSSGSDVLATLLNINPTAVLRTTPRPVRVLLRLPALLCCATQVAAISFGHASDGTSFRKPQDRFKEIWSLAEIYRSDSDAILESFALTGRFQLDYALYDADEGSYDDWKVRRFRFGFKARLFESTTAHLEGDLDIQKADPFYKRLTDANISWSFPNEGLKVRVGKQGASFTLDGTTSSKRLLTIDRNNLSNNLWFTKEYMPGITVSGKSSLWRYSVGLFSAGSDSREFGRFDGSGFVLSSITRDFSGDRKDRVALVSLHYVYQEPDVNNTFTRPHEHIVSLNFKYDSGNLGFRGDVATSQGYGAQSDLLGAVAMPYLGLTENLQVVTRYTYLHSSDDNGIRLARYDSRIESGRGDKYNEFYGGLNAYFYGHKLKFQTGVSYSVMDDRAKDGGRFRGWGWTSALRISW